MKQLKAAILGCGNRGLNFAEVVERMQDKYEIVALCDTDPDQIEKLHIQYKDWNTEDFYNVDEFFKAKRADFVFIATPDRVHIQQAITAMKLGYDLFLEKPISDDREELELLLKTQRETKRKIVVCHELRYGAGYRKCFELLESGIIGKLNLIEASERPVYWHWAQAYVRGIGKALKDGHPCILAKCSHDLDLIQAYAKSKCKTVSSVGDLRFFKRENAPEGSAERCIDCKYKETCVYSAKKIYVDRWKIRKPVCSWPYSKVCVVPPLTEEKLLKALETSDYGICAFKCENDQVDHQIVQMEFENGVKASLSMIYGAKPGRRYAFYGSLGEIILDERSDDITVMPYGGETEVIKLDTLIEGGHAHGGGDTIIVEEMYDMLCGNVEVKTDVEESIESHLMGIAAEESRKNGGKVVTVHK